MALNQSRMITMTNAAFLSLKALNRIRTFIRTLEPRILSGQMPPAVAYAELINLIEDNERLFPPDPSFAPDLQHVISTYARIEHVINSELSHFSKRAKDNDMSRLRSARFRDRHNPDRRQRRRIAHSLYETNQLVAHTNAPQEPDQPPRQPFLSEEEFEEALKQYSSPLPSSPPIESDPPTLFDHQTPLFQPSSQPETIPEPDDPDEIIIPHGNSGSL